MKSMDLSPYATFFKDYTELRAQENRNYQIVLVNGDIMSNFSGSKSGICARVYRQGVWGFSSNPEVSSEAIKQTVQSAAHNASFLHSREQKGAGPLPVVQAVSQEDFTTSIIRRSRAEIMEFLREIDDFIIQNCPKLSSRTLILSGLDMEKTLLTSEGSSAFSMIPRTILVVMLSVERQGEPFELYSLHGGFGQYEDNFLEPLTFGLILEQYDHLLRKSEGVYAETGFKECILDADLAGILAHEAIGHTTEADFVLGGSIASEYLDEEVASPLITLTDFAHTALNQRCPVPVFVDDEGTKAEDVVIIEKGILKGYMHNKETALRFGVKPTGNARAFLFSDEPLIRMRNTTILPRKDRVGDMIASIDDGYYLIRSSNGQADSTSEFMFGIVLGYEIKHGKIGRAIRDTTISGVAFDVLKTVTMISGDMSWICAGMCGKKQPIPVGMGGPAIKCKVNIGGR
ncbi:TldD/PmbA family protein [candidate division CSSED10-310 bacterium]|uniref:TldD/PmbA family protein n=1 Tax=candidate division CSSED10-310 bacterium TaxID=2855610 RepID=A0ABV6YS46_UNCC1